MRILFTAAVILLLTLSAFAPQTTAPPNPTPALQKQLDAMATQHRGNVSLYAKNLKTGEVAQIDPDHVVQTASVIKLAIFVEAFHDIKDGKKSLTDKVDFKPEDRVLGSGILQFLHAPLEITLEDAMVLMMIESDNTATNLMTDQVV